MIRRAAESTHAEQCDEIMLISLNNEQGSGCFAI